MMAGADAVCGRIPAGRVADAAVLGLAAEDGAVLRGGTGGSRRLEDGAAQGRKFNTKVL
jgi:hypothetical protein